jgi:hypothetical protein
MPNFGIARDPGAIGHAPKRQPTNQPTGCVDAAALIALTLGSAARRGRVVGESCSIWARIFAPQLLSALPPGGPPAADDRYLNEPHWFPLHRPVFRAVHRGGMPGTRHRCTSKSRLWRPPPPLRVYTGRAGHCPTADRSRPSNTASNAAPSTPCKADAPSASRPPLANAGRSQAIVTQAIKLYARKAHETPRLAGADGVWRAPQQAIPRDSKPPPAIRAKTNPGPANGDRRRREDRADGSMRSPNPIPASRTPPMLNIGVSQSVLFRGASTPICWTFRSDICTLVRLLWKDAGTAASPRPASSPSVSVSLKLANPSPKR